MPDAEPPLIRSEICAPAMVRRVAAMLDLDPSSLAEGEQLPRGWHFFLLAAETRRRDLRSDGFPGLGVPMPDLGLPRLVLAGRTVRYDGELPIGAMIERRSMVQSVTRKDDDGGGRAIVTLAHELRPAGQEAAAIVETQTYVLLPARTAGGTAQPAPRPDPARSAPAATKTLVPDSTLLFQYSALGFNSHKIHVDRDFAREAEGYPDLVVNGGLIALLLTEFARQELGLNLRGSRMKHKAPLFCDHKMTLAAAQEEGGWRLQVFDDTGVLAAEAELEAE
jgi:3-methylfumaryl-CoA hydratase